MQYLPIVHSINQKENSINNNYEKKDMITLTKKEEENYNNQKVCYICEKEFDKSDKKYYKVRDHCHYTGKYRGAAHNV